MESKNCNLCGSSQYDVLYSYDGDKRLGIIGGTYKLVKCSNCNLIYLNPRPTRFEISEYYPEDYEPYQYSPIEKTSNLARWLQRYGLRRKCRLIMKHKRCGRLLDVGTATGNFLDEMRRYGSWELHGVELNETVAQQARDQLGLDVFTGELAQAQYPDRYFDVVTFWHVFEHLFDPQADLSEIGRILKPNGIVVIEIPNPNGLEAKIFRRFWVGWDPPRHLYIFSQLNLEELLQKSGFRRIEVKYLSSGYHSFIMSLDWWLDEHPNNISIVMRKVSHSGLMRFLSFPIFLLLRWLRKSSSMVLIAELES